MNVYFSQTKSMVHELQFFFTNIQMQGQFMKSAEIKINRAIFFLTNMNNFFNK